MARAAASGSSANNRRRSNWLDDLGARWRCCWLAGWPADSYYNYQAARNPSPPGLAVVVVVAVAVAVVVADTYSLAFARVLVRV